jgi:hypothetical protein
MVGTPTSFEHGITVRVRSLLLATGLGVAGLGGAGMIGGLLIDDPDRTFEPIRVGVSISGTTTPPPAEGPGSQAVEGLEQLVGELRPGDEADDWYVAGVEVDFGPEAWLFSDPAVGDFDRDGRTEPVLAELHDLDGAEVTLGVRYEPDDQRDDADVFTVNGVTYRDAAGDDTPWQTDIQSLVDHVTVSTTAALAVGEGARVVEVEWNTEDGWGGWEVDVVSGDGAEFDVFLDATGAVVDMHPGS